MNLLHQSASYVQTIKGDELFFKVDFKNLRTLLSLHMYEAASKYINKSLAHSIQTMLALSLTVAKIIKKREKASKTLQLSGQLAIKKLYKKRQAELDKNQPKGQQHLQQFRTILLSDARLGAIVRNKHEEAEIKRIRVQKEESQLKKQLYREGVDACKAERLAKMVEKEVIKAARAAN